jgi:hypothetical protein
MDDKDRKTSNIDNLIIQLVKSKHPKTVKKLLELVHQEYSLPQQKILEHILNLQNQGKLTFEEDSTLIPSTIKGYLSSPHSYWFWTIITLAFATTATVFTIPENAYPIVYARYMLGSIFVVFLPGYSLTKALFPEKEIDNIERVALSIGMSLALVPITGLLLNYTPWGIRATPLTVSLLALTTIFATAAIIREQQTKTKPKMQPKQS